MSEKKIFRFVKRRRPVSLCDECSCDELPYDESAYSTNEPPTSCPRPSPHHLDCDQQRRTTLHSYRRCTSETFKLRGPSKVGNDCRQLPACDAQTFLGEGTVCEGQYTRPPLPRLRKWTLPVNRLRCILIFKQI